MLRCLCDRESLVITQHRLEHFGGYRRAKVIALKFIAAVLPQIIELALCFHALGDNAQIQTMRHGDDSSGDSGITRIVRDVANEAAIDLYKVEWKAFQVSQ